MSVSDTAMLVFLTISRQIAVVKQQHPRNAGRTAQLLTSDILALVVWAANLGKEGPETADQAGRPGFSGSQACFVHGTWRAGGNRLLSCAVPHPVIAETIPAAPQHDMICCLHDASEMTPLYEPPTVARDSRVLCQQPSLGGP